MNPKLSAILGLLIFAAGAFVGNKLKSNTPPPAMSQYQQQAQAQNQGQSAQGGCVAEVGKKTNADGSVEDFFRFRASMAVSQGQSSDSSQAQSQKIDSGSSLDIFAGGGVSSKIQGWGSVEAVTGRHSFEYLTNGPEYIGLYKIKVISF